MEIRTKIAEILTILLNQEITSNSDISMQNCEMWDSMKHIEIITTLNLSENVGLPQ